MTTKALRKQLAAAIAMVVVAGVALSSSTYAWFVSNNTVKATTATISAQSNAPFLMIDKTSITKDSSTSITFVADPAVDTKLYPAQVIKATATDKYGTDNKVMTANAPLFQSAYAGASNKADILSNSRFNVGTADVASTDEYALKETFKIGTYDSKAGSFKDLKVAKVELTNATSSQLADALCVLVTCGDNWAIYKATTDGTVLAKYNDNTVAGSYSATDNAGVLADTIDAASSVDVNVYVFYDGSAEKVYTDNLTNLKAIGATVTFTATPVNADGTSSSASNGV